MKVSVHMNGRGVIVPFVVVALFLAACSGDGASTVRPTSTPTLRPTAEPTMEPEPTATEPIGTMKQYNGVSREWCKERGGDFTPPWNIGGSKTASICMIFVPA